MRVRTPSRSNGAMGMRRIPPPAGSRLALGLLQAHSRQLGEVARRQRQDAGRVDWLADRRASTKRRDALPVAAGLLPQLVSWGCFALPTREEAALVGKGDDRVVALQLCQQSASSVIGQPIVAPPGFGRYPPSSVCRCSRRLVGTGRRSRWRCVTNSPSTCQREAPQSPMS